MAAQIIAKGKALIRKYGPIVAGSYTAGYVTGSNGVNFKFKAVTATDNRGNEVYGTEVELKASEYEVKKRE